MADVLAWREKEGKEEERALHRRGPLGGEKGGQGMGWAGREGNRPKKGISARGKMVIFN